MISSFSLENFKAFRKLDNLKVKPITVLCGTNSCGKSSILQSILLMKQTMENRNPNELITLNGRFVELGAFENIVYQKKSGSIVTFDFCFSIKDLDKYDSAALLLEELSDGLRNIFHENRCEFRIYYKVKLKYSKPEHDKSNLKSTISVHGWEFRVETINDNGEIVPRANIEIKGDESKGYSIIWKNMNQGVFHPGSGSFKMDNTIEFSNTLPILSRLKVEEFNNYIDKPIFDFLILSELRKLLQEIFDSYTYIGPLRAEPKRFYVSTSEAFEIDKTGENAAFLYAKEAENIINNHYFYDNDNGTFIEAENLKLKEAVKRWLNQMDVLDFDPEIINGIIYLNLDSNTSEVTRVGIADVGFGVSQIFPIILEGLRMPKGNTLMLEQPEIHLHPDLQMQMADYFVSLALSGKNVMVETHSDHVIHRLVRRIVEDKTNKLKDLIGIYFIRPMANGVKYEEVCIDENKGIVNWPYGFFDQAATELEKIMRAGLEKRKAAREREEKQ